MGALRYGYYTYRSRHDRAFTKSGRNRFWHRVVTKTKYKVEILYRSCSLPEILKKEYDFILLYGRRDLKTGTLVNLKPGGGDYNKGFKHSEKTKQKFRSRIRPKGGDCSFSKPIFVYSNKTGVFLKEYRGAPDICEELKIPHRSQIYECASGKNKSHYAFGYLFYYSYMGEKVPIYKTRVNLPIGPIYCFDMNYNFIKEYATIQEASLDTQISISKLSNCCKSGRCAYDLYWKCANSPPFNRGGRKFLYLYHLNGTSLTFNSIEECARYFGLKEGGSFRKIIDTGKRRITGKMSGYVIYSQPIEIN